MPLRRMMAALHNNARHILDALEPPEVGKLLIFVMELRVTEVQIILSIAPQCRAPKLQ